MKVENFAQPNVVVLDAQATLNAAVKQLFQGGFRHLVVTEDGQPVGMLSDRDILLHAFSSTDDPGEIRIGQVMTKPIVALDPSDHVLSAINLMLNKHLSALPLFKEGLPVGIITRTDLLRCFTDEQSDFPSAACRTRSVTDHMSTDVRSIDPDDATTTAIRMMLDGHIRHLPVVRNGTLFGIVSDRDVLRGGPRNDDRQPASVADLRTSRHPEIRGVMTKQPVTLDPSSMLVDAAGQMVSHRIGALPVVDGTTLLGLITETDLLRVLVIEVD